MQGVERELPVHAAIARTRDCRRYDDWTERFLCTCMNVESVQSVDKRSILLGLRFHVHCSRARIDRRSAGDSNLRYQIAAAGIGKAVHGRGA